MRVGDRKFRRARYKKHMEILVAVNGVSFFELHARTIEKVDVATFNSAWIRQWNE